MDSAICLKYGRGLCSVSPSRLIVYFFIFWLGGWSRFLPVRLSSLISLALTSIGFLFFIIDFYNGKNKRLGVAVIVITMICPIIESIQAYRLFGQPIWMGVASLRGIWSLFLSYLLCRFSNPYQLINCIVKYQLIMIYAGIVCLYVLNIDDNTLKLYFPQQEDIVLTGQTENNELRGARLTFGQTYLLLCLAFWIVKLKETKERKYIWYIFLVFFDYLFIHKGRSGLIAAIIVLALPYFSHLNVKRFFKICGISIIVGLIFLSVPPIRDRFLVIYDLFGNNRTEGTGDFSGVARLSEILLAFPLILQHPFLGVGNLSYHYKNGFLGYFGDHFFIGDIGIVGILLIGGINLYIWYIFFFRSIKKNIPKNFLLYGMISSLSIYAIINPFIGGNALWETPRFAIFLLALSLMCKKRKKYE